MLMNNILSFVPEKYKDPVYIPHGHDIFEMNGTYFISLSFQQEIQLGEGTNPRNISQYPLEDILEQYGVWVSDFYEKLNSKSKDTCYLEFAGNTIDDIRALRGVIGKHVYNRTSQENGSTVQKLVIE